MLCGVFCWSLLLLSVFLFLVFYTVFFFTCLPLRYSFMATMCFAGYFHALFPSVCFPFFISLAVVPIWFAYLVTTAGFVAGQSICDKQQKQNAYDHGLDFDVRMYYYVKISHSKYMHKRQFIVTSRKMLCMKNYYAVKGMRPEVEPAQK